MATRRSFLKSAAAVAAAPLAIAASKSGVKKYGLLTVGGHRHHLHSTGETLRVYLNGREVTSVYEADDVEGYVKVFCRDGQQHRDLDAQGALHINKHEDRVCLLLVRGPIVIKPGPEKV